MAHGPLLPGLISYQLSKESLVLSGQSNVGADPKGTAAIPGEQEPAPDIADAHRAQHSIDGIVPIVALVVDHQQPVAELTQLSDVAVKLVSRDTVLLDQIHE